MEELERNWPWRLLHTDIYTKSHIINMTHTQSLASNLKICNVFVWICLYVFRHLVKELWDNFVKSTFSINGSRSEALCSSSASCVVWQTLLPSITTWQPDWWNMLCRLELNCLDTVCLIEHLHKAPLVFSYVSADKSGIVAERGGTPCWARLTGTTTRLCYQRQQR